MVDKIDSSANRPHATGAGHNPATPTSTTGSAGSGSARGDNTDQLRLTASALALRELQEAVANTPAIDSGKVAEIRQALADGTYRIDAARIAAKLRELDQLG